MLQMDQASAQYQYLRTRLKTEDPDLDEETLADTIEGITDLHEILVAIIRSALVAEALATGLRGQIERMKERLERLEDRASKRRQIARDVMVECEIKKITAPDFALSIRPGSPSLVVNDETAIPSTFWVPRDPRLDRQGLLDALKRGGSIAGVALSNPQPVLSVRSK